MAKPNVLILAITGSASARSFTNLTTHEQLMHRVSLRPMGAFQIAHHLRAHGFSCQVMIYLQEFLLEELLLLVDRCIDHNTIIGVSHVFPNKEKFLFVIDVLTHIRQKFPKNKIVIGGNSVLNKQFQFDAYFTGYSEDSFLEYVEQHHGRRPKLMFADAAWHQGAPVIDSDDCVDHRFQIENLDHRWGQPDCIIDREILPIEISRGCIFKCTFCGYRLNGKKKFDYIRDPKKVAEEMLFNYDNWGITKYQFLDDTFNDSTGKLQGLQDAFAGLPFKPEFWAYLRADLLHAHPEQISMLKSMGLKAAFLGIETLNQQSATSVGKGLKIEKMKTFLHDLYHKHWPDIAVMASFIIGLPYETTQSQRQTFDWQRNYPKWSFLNNTLSLVASSDNISLLCADPEKYGYTWSNDYRQHPDWTTSQIKHHWVNNMGMSQNDAVQLAHESPFGYISHKFSLTQQFFLSSFSNRDLSQESKDTLSELVIHDYQHFIDQYKNRLREIVKSY